MSKIAGFVLKFVFGVILFAGLPLVGWGVRDWQGFAAHPARLAFLAEVVVLQLVVLTAFPDIGRHHGPGEKTVQRQRVAVALLQILSLAMVLAPPYGDRHGILALGEWDVVRWPGLILLAFGFVGMMWAEAALGKQFSVQVTLQEGHNLVTSGPYRHVRHPRYLSIMVFNVGIALVFRSGLGLILTAALTAVLIWRVHDEEHLLGEAFGDEWEAYTKRSRRLIPFVF